MARSLRGQGQQPFEHYIGRLSEEMGGAPPTVVFRELDRLPPGFLEQMIEYRRFAEVFTAIERADSAEARQALRQHPLGELADEIEFELARDEE